MLEQDPKQLQCKLNVFVSVLSVSSVLAVGYFGFCINKFWRMSKVSAFLSIGGRTLIITCFNRVSYDQCLLWQWSVTASWNFCFLNRGWARLSIPGIMWGNLMFRKGWDFIWRVGQAVFFPLSVRVDVSSISEEQNQTSCFFDVSILEFS